jgi:hypothetical protein
VDSFVWLIDKIINDGITAKIKGKRVTVKKYPINSAILSPKLTAIAMFSNIAKKQPMKTDAKNSFLFKLPSLCITLNITGKRERFGRSPASGFPVHVFVMCPPVYYRGFAATNS